MATPVIMPRQGQSVESCTISEWFKKKGDTVKKGDILLTYETDKASFELEAPEDGILIEIFFNTDDDVPVLENLAVIGKEGEATDAYKPGSTKAPAEQVEAGNISSENITVKLDHSRSNVTASPTKKVSPRAKLMAEKMGISIESITGSGPYGRVIARDIEAFNKNGSGKQAGAEMIQEPRVLEQLPAYLKETNSYYPSKEGYGDDSESKKVTNVRRIIAENMHRSLQNSAQLTHHMSADARNILNLRSKFKTDPDRSGITLNDMICHAVIKALRKHPDANSHFLGDQIRTFKKVHLGIAVDTDRGLMVPTLKNADDLSLTGLSNQLKAIANACKKGSIDPELLASTAASFTVSNLGAYGVEMFTPVINLPQVGILGVNTIINRPADLGNGVFAFVPYLGLSLTYDHRALDGAPASAFLRTIKEEVEKFEYKD